MNLYLVWPLWLEADPGLSGTESRISNCKIPESQAWNRQNFCSEMHKSELNRHKVESRKINLESLVGITTYLLWADPGVLWKKAPRAIRAMRGKTLQTVPFNAFQPYSGCTKSFPKVLSAKRFQATKAMKTKRAVTVALQPYFGFH